MQLILRADVDNLGRLGDQVKVKPGYARNYLIPKGLAMPATAANLKQFELERKKLGARMDAIRSEARSMAEKIENAELIIEVRVGEGEKLYGSVTSAMIADRLAEKGIEIDRRIILLEQPIRSLGEYDVPVKLHPDVTADLKVYVIRQGGSIADLQPAEETEAAETEAAEVAAAPEAAETEPAQGE